MTKVPLSYPVNLVLNLRSKSRLRTVHRNDINGGFGVKGMNILPILSSLKSLFYTYLVRVDKILITHSNKSLVCKIVTLYVDRH